MLSPAWHRTVRRTLASLVLVLGLAAPVAAQEATLTLEEAVALARRHNPEFLAQKNDEGEADWSVRESYGALLPSLMADGSMQYQAAGAQRFGLLTGGDLGFQPQTGYLFSSYSLGINYRLASDVLLRPAQERANRRATLARIEAADHALRADVAYQYLAVLRAQDAVALARQELERAEENLKLATARVAVGSAIALESKQAGVERGRAEVELLKAENLLRTERLRLMERLGIELDREPRLTSTFPVFEPDWSKDELIGMALDRHPQLRALRAAERASGAAVNMARGRYLPTLDLALGWSGYTREATNGQYLVDQARRAMQSRMNECKSFNEIAWRLEPPLPQADCGQLALRPEDEAAILAGNDAFPFRFQREPFFARLQLSLPIFNGFSRERQLETAQVTADDARHRLRSEELRIKTEVSSLYHNVRTAYRAVVLEERTRALGAEQLELARERYNVGLASFLELLEAETLKARADRAYLAAVYAYHEGIAALEAAVGGRLGRAAEEDR